MKKIIGLLLLGATGMGAAAQSASDSSKAKELDEVVVSGSRFAARRQFIVQPIDVINATAIRRANAQNMGDLLLTNGKLFVQKSQQGGSSPVIRGFEASRVLLVVDGVRMNNAIYRSGHLQNIITVDQNMLERVEVIQGPSSTLFGGDALGGTIHMISRQPVLSSSGTVQWRGGAFVRYSTANEEKTIHQDVEVGGKKWAALTSFTYSNFGDMRIGHHDKKGFEGFGTRPLYIQPMNGMQPDTILANPNVRKQVYSGYRQWDLLQKILFQPGKHVTHLLNLQHSNTSDVPRYDRLQDIKNGNLRYAEWYYGPQTRTLLSYQLQASQLSGFFNEYRAVLSYQDIRESRITREYKRYDRFDRRQEDLAVGGATLDARRVSEQDELTVGVDMQWNGLQSTASRSNLLTLQQSKLDSRYPDGRNQLWYAAAYAQHIHRFRNTGWVLNEGIRLQKSHLHSRIIDNSFLQLPITDMQQDNQALTGNLGLLYRRGGTTVRLGLASGFRAPNIDDLSKIFESSTAARQVVVPNTGIKPEKTTGLDLSVEQRWSGGLEMEAGIFHTWFTDALVKAPYRLNGQDSILYNGVMSQVMANQNMNQARVSGAYLTVRWKMDRNWMAEGTVNWQEGKFNSNSDVASTIYQRQKDGSYQVVQAKVDRKPLDHIPPVYGRLGLNYENKDWVVEGYLLFNGWKKLDQYNADGEDNAQYATAEGTPAWQTINLRAGYQCYHWLQLQLGVENLLDVNYRYFASGYSAPGRNLVLTLRTHF